MALSILELEVGEIEEILLKERNFGTIAVETTTNKHGRIVMESNKTFNLLNLLFSYKSLFDKQIYKYY